MIVRKGKLVEYIRPAEDFQVKVIYVTSEFIVLSTPLSNYGMKGQLALFLNPIMTLDAGQWELCRKDFEMVELGISCKEAKQESSRCLRCDHFGYGIFKGGRVDQW